MKTIAILYGWGGGPKHTRLFNQELEKSGFQVIKDAASADIIFAHSAGCYRLPSRIQAELLVLHAPPYWPERPLMSRFLAHGASNTAQIIRNHGYWYTVRRRWWELFYALRYPQTTIAAFRNHKTLEFLNHEKSKPVLLLRNRGDHLCSPEIESIARQFKNIHFVELPGGHDDYLTNPKPHIAAIIADLK